MSNNTTADTADSGAGEIEPVAWVERTDSGLTRMWSGDLSAWANRPASPEPLYSQATVDTLRAQIEAAEAEKSRLTGCLTQANCNAEEFERKWYLSQDRAEAAEADAARYRWLRDRMVPEELTCATIASFVGSTMGPVGVRPADDCDATEFDAAIDAARATP